MEQNLGEKLPFLLFSCQEGNVQNKKLNGPQVMVSSYLADMEVCLVWSWKKRGRSLWFLHSWELSGHLSLPGSPPIPRSKTQQQQADKSHTWIPPAFPEVSLAPAFLQEDAGGSKRLAVKHSLMLREGLRVWNQNPLHNVKYYHCFTEKEVDTEVKCLSL